MIALYKKELRALLPLIFLCSLLSGDIFQRPFVDRLDETTWTAIAVVAEPGDDSIPFFGFLLALLALSVAYAAFPREHDERTIELLYSLPIRRSSIFVAKVAAGLTVLWGSVVLFMTTEALLASFNHQSISGGQWRLDLALELASLTAFYYGVVYAHGLLASVFRLFGLIPYLLLIVLVGNLDDLLPVLQWVSPSAILEPQYHGRELVYPVGPMIAHSIVALVALALAYFAWMGPAERIGRALAALRETVLAKAALGCMLSLGVCFIGIVALGLLVGGPIAEEGTDLLGPIQTGRRTTAHYVFTYPVSHRARARVLMAQGDALYEEIARRLDASAGPRLAADLTEVSGEHLGIAAWTHVRVGIATEPNPVRLRRTFAHETVHAFQHRLSDNRQGQQRDATRFFAEGSAEHLAYQLVPDPEGLAENRTIGAAAWQRHRMSLPDLVDDRRLHERFDPDLVYTLGEMWTAALVATHGERAIGDALRALGRDDAPRHLEPRALWEDTLRAADCDLESVDARFVRMIAAIADAERARIDALPRIGGGVAGREAGTVLIVASLDREPLPGFRYWVRVRRGPDADDTEVTAIEGWADGASTRRIRFRVPSVLLPGRRFQLLFSIRTHPETWAWSETWQWASAPR